LAKDCAEQVCQSLSSDSILEKSEIKKFIRSYDEFYVKRWPQERYISNETDPTEISPHPQPIPDLARSEWDGTLLFAGTETDLNSPGVMEGAVGAAIRVTKELSERLSISTE
jgi:monoamine oxidase